MESTQVHTPQPPSPTPARSSAKNIFSLFGKTKYTDESSSGTSFRKPSQTLSTALSEVFSTAATSSSESSYDLLVQRLTSQNDQLRSRCEELQITANVNQTILDQCVADMEAKKYAMKAEMSTLRGTGKGLSTQLTSADELDQQSKVEGEQKHTIERMAHSTETLIVQRDALQVKLEMKSDHALRLQFWGCRSDPDAHASRSDDHVEVDTKLKNVQDDAEVMQVKLDSLAHNGRATEDKGKFEAVQQRLTDMSEKLAYFQKLVQDKDIEISRLDVDCRGLEAAIGQLEWECDQLRKESKSQKKRIHTLKVEIEHLRTQKVNVTGVVSRTCQRSGATNRELKDMHGESGDNAKSRDEAVDESEEDNKLWRNSMLHLAPIVEFDTSQQQVHNSKSKLQAREERALNFD